jgi:hypothetical protein
MEATMKYLKWAVLAMLIGWGASGVAWAQRGSHSGGHFSGGHVSGGHHFGGHANFGVFLGAGLLWPWYYGPYYAPYYYPYSYYPPMVEVPSGPQVYIEEESVALAPPPQQRAPAQAPTSWWYFCQKTQSYYPYVKECPGGWQKVAPQPPTQ